MEKIVLSELDQQLFEKELDVLIKSEEICEILNDSEQLTFEKLSNEYFSLKTSYEKILRACIKITNIGDMSQQKLYFALKKINQQKNDIQDRNVELYQLSISDHLTKIYNRTFVIEKFEDEFRKSEIAKSDLCCILFDVDHFKLINDNHGHLVGDFVIEKLAAVIKNKLDDKYYFGRYGGEEFLIVLPQCSIPKGREIAEQIRNIVKETSFVYNSIEIKVTISLGVAGNKDKSVSSVDNQLNNADKAMYDAKKLGRNRTELF